MQNENDTSNFELEGVTTEQSFLPEEMPVASEGNFLVKNTSSKSATIYLQEVFFKENTELQPIRDFSIYSDDKELENPFTVDPGSNLRFRVTYPFRNIKVNSKLTYHVYLKAEINGKAYEAKAELIFMVEDNKSF